MKHNIYQINYNQHEGGIFLTEISTTNIAENLYYVDDIERIRENSFACNTFTQLSQYKPVRIYHYIPFPMFIFSCLRLNYNSLFQNESFCMFLDRFFFLYNWTVTFGFTNKLQCVLCKFTKFLQFLTRIHHHHPKHGVSRTRPKLQKVECADPGFLSGSMLTPTTPSLILLKK